MALGERETAVRDIIGNQTGVMLPVRGYPSSVTQLPPDYSIIEPNQANGHFDNLCLPLAIPISNQLPNKTDRGIPHFDWGRDELCGIFCGARILYLSVGMLAHILSQAFPLLVSVSDCN